MIDSQRRPYFGYAVALLGVGLILSAPIGILSDGLVRFQTLEQLLQKHRLDPVKFSLAGPICATPLWYLGEAIGSTEYAVGTLNRILFLGLFVGLWFTLTPILRERERLRFLIFLTLGSMFPWHAMGFFGEMFHASCVGLGLAIVATREDRWRWLGWILIILGTVNIPASVVGLAFALAVLCWQRSRLRYFLPLGLAVALILLENQLRRGDPLNGGYDNDRGFATALPYSGLPNFSYPLFFGLLSILFSFGKGLVFFAPGMFLPGPERESKTRSLYFLWIAIIVGLILVYARWWAWYGGGVWGPRFFLFASIPASLVLALRSASPELQSVRMNLLVLAATALSCWVGANGLVFEMHGLDKYFADDYALESLTWYAPECSVLWSPFVNPKPLMWYDYLRLTGFAIGFSYLAWPVAKVLVLQTGTRVRELWRTFPQFRI